MNSRFHEADALHKQLCATVSLCSLINVTKIILFRKYVCKGFQSLASLNKAGVFAKTCYKTHFFICFIWKFPESPYLCTVFFIVLDLRLTKVGVQRYSFFMPVRPVHTSAAPAHVRLQPLKPAQKFLERHTAIRFHLLHTNTLQALLYRIFLQMHDLRHFQL